MKDDKPINFTREAFMHPMNLAGMFIMTLSALLLNDIGNVANIILALTFGAELTYLGTIPQMPKFRKLIELKKAKERDKKAEDQNMFQKVDPRSQKRFLVMKHLSRLIRDNFQKLPYTSQGILTNVNSKIDGLLSSYLNLLELNYRYRQYISSANVDNLKDQIEDEKASLEAIESEKLKEKKNRRLGILTKRLERFAKAKEKYDICETEIETIEDAVRYIYEQSMTMSNIEEIGDQLDNLLLDMEETASMIGDIDVDMLDNYSILDKSDVFGDSEANEEGTIADRIRE